MDVWVVCNVEVVHCYKIHRRAAPIIIVAISEVFEFCVKIATQDQVISFNVVGQKIVEFRKILSNICGGRGIEGADCKITIIRE